MLKKLLFAAALLLGSAAAQAGVTVTFVPGQILPAAQLNAAFAQAATYADLSATTGAGLIGVSQGGTLQSYLNGLSTASPVWGGQATGTANALVLSPSPALTAYTPAQPLYYKAASTNTGAVTAQWSSLGALPVVDQTGAALSAGAIVGGVDYVQYFDPIAGALVNSITVSNLVTLSTAQTITGAKTFSAASTFNGSATFNAEAIANRVLVAGATDDGASILQVGSSTAGSTATPAVINMGSTFSNVAGANPKLQLYNATGTTAGIGISGGQMDFIVPSNAFSYAFYNAGTLLFQLSTSVAAFGVIPETSIAPTSGIHLTNKTYVDGKYASPPAIGNTTPNTGAFTTLSATTSTSAGALTATSASFGTTSNSNALNFNAGSLGFQCVGLNNCIFGENLQYTSGNFQYLYNGYAERVYFADGDISLTSFASGTAGTGLPATGALLKVTQGGVVALGGSISVAVGSTTGAAMLVGANNAAIGTSLSSSGYLNLAPTTSTLAPVLLQPSSGTLLTTPVNGALENDGTHLYFTSGGTRTNLLAPGAAATGFAFGGDGSDGAVTISSNTTLTRDMFYSSLTVNSSVTLNTNGWRIYCTGTITNNGTIAYNGASATSNFGGANSESNNLTVAQGAQGGNGGLSSAGVAGLSATVSYGGAGGAGGAGTNAAGAGGTATAPTAAQGSIRTATAASQGIIQSTSGYAGGGSATIYAISPGAGGGGGGGTSSNYGGGGGAGGGIVLIAAATIVNNGTIEALGGNGFTPTAGTSCGGGGGGGGGVLLLVTSAAISGANTLLVTGGVHGNGFGTGSAGTSGSAGTIVQIVAN